MLQPPPVAGKARSSSGPRPSPAVHRLGEGEEILLALEKRAEERQRFVQLHALHTGAAQHRDPVDQLARRGTLAQTLDVSQLVEGAQRLVEQLAREIGMVDADD